jgi:protein-arginine kinase activator protein McsA
LKTLITSLEKYFNFFFQPAHPGKYKNTNPVPCYYCPAHCASRKALQAHVKEAHSVVKPPVKPEPVTDQPGAAADSDSDEKRILTMCVRTKEKKHIYPCRPCNKSFEEQKDLLLHQQMDHFECDNCYKFFNQVLRENTTIQHSPQLCTSSTCTASS